MYMEMERYGKNIIILPKTSKIYKKVRKIGVGIDGRCCYTEDRQQENAKELIVIITFISGGKRI